MKTLSRILLSLVLLALLAACDPTLVQTPVPTVAMPQEATVVPTQPATEEPPDPTETPLPEEPFDDLDLANQDPEVYLFGVWEYECRYCFSTYTWLSQMTVADQVLIVEIEFERWEWSTEREHILPIRIYPDDPSHEYSWLYISEDGVLDPDLSYFRDSNFVLEYFGTYENFLSEFEKHQIIWEYLYEMVRSSGEEMYLNEDPTICPDSTPLPEPKLPPLPLPWDELNA